MQSTDSTEPSSPLKLVPAIIANQQQFIDVRHRLHSHPEIGFDVSNTAGIVAGMLQAWGYKVHTGIGGTGIVAQLKLGNSSRTMGVRADMDALPIHEETGLSYASTLPGKMHACGHDGHTAILLAAARYLAQNRNFDGTLNLIFQPDEENLCGARAMMDDGLFTRFPCDAVYALHNAPGLPVGTALARGGPLTYSSDTVDVLLKGIGGHGAMPHKASDAIVAAGSIILALQTIVARNLAPSETGVVSIGAINAGSTHNVIPETVSMKLNVRATTPENRALIEQRIRDIVTFQARAYGVQAEIDYRQLVPVLVNSAAETEYCRTALNAVLGEEQVLRELPVGMMGSEDFAWMLESVPGCYIALGNGVGEFGGCMVHNSHYDFNDQLIGIGASFWCRLVEQQMPVPVGLNGETRLN